MAWNLLRVSKVLPDRRWKFGAHLYFRKVFGCDVPYLLVFVGCIATLNHQGRIDFTRRSSPNTRPFSTLSTLSMSAYKHAHVRSGCVQLSSVFTASPYISRDRPFGALFVFVVSIHRELISPLFAVKLMEF